MIKVSVIGSGNVAESLALALSECSSYSDIELHEVAGRSESRIAEITQMCGVRGVTIDALSPADIYILAVSDGAIDEVAQQIPHRTDALLLHTAGSVPMGSLDGVLYPMQSFTAGRRVNFREVPLFIEGANKELLSIIDHLATTLSDSVVELSSERRKELHLAAVFACNFINAMLTATTDILSRAELPLSLYRPLVEETIAKAFEMTPQIAQTGAARRGDHTTQQCHEAMLEGDLKDIYSVISRYIWEISKRI